MSLPVDDPNVQLAWSDEFNGAADSPPDPRWWSHETGAHGWGNGELQRYTNNTVNAAHDGRGNLVIRAAREGAGYSSARLVTKGRVTFRFGRLECRLRLPRGAGLWSAVWTLGSNIDEVGWPACGEIDLMENLGAEPERIFGTVHCPGRFGQNGPSGDHVGPAPQADGFRVFAVDWRPDKITWSADGMEYFRMEARDLGPAWVFDHSFFLLLNLAVGGDLGGEVAAATAFPAEMAVDYVRIFARPQDVWIQELGGAARGPFGRDGG